jgi:hypothetical protein
MKENLDISPKRRSSRRGKKSTTTRLSMKQEASMVLCYGYFTRDY